VLTREEILKIKNFSKSSKFSDSPWKTWEPEMWVKSAIRRLAKFLPQAPYFQMAAEYDAMVEGGKTPVLEGTGMSDSFIEMSLSSEEMFQIRAEGEPEPEKLGEPTKEETPPKKSTKPDSTKTEKPEAEATPVDDFPDMDKEGNLL
jgi:recombinational DNA repair protein RecT